MEGNESIELKAINWSDKCKKQFEGITRKQTSNKFCSNFVLLYKNKNCSRENSFSRKTHTCATSRNHRMCTDCLRVPFRMFSMVLWHQVVCLSFPYQWRGNHSLLFHGFGRCLYLCLQWKGAIYLHQPPLATALFIHLKNSSINFPDISTNFYSELLALREMVSLMCNAEKNFFFLVTHWQWESRTQDTSIKMHVFFPLIEYTRMHINKSY